MLSVAVLEADGGGLAELLVGQAGVTVESAATIEELKALVTDGAVEVILVDPALPEGWPTSIATEVAERLASTLPVVLACRSAYDLQAIRCAVTGKAEVVSRGVLDCEGLMAILQGEVAKRRAGCASS